jgi:hypothetical protein
MGHETAAGAFGAPPLIRRRWENRQAFGNPALLSVITAAFQAESSAGVGNERRLPHGENERRCHQRAQVVAPAGAGAFCIFCTREPGRKIPRVREREKKTMPASAMFSWPLRTLRLNLTCTKNNRCHKNSQLPHIQKRLDIFYSFLKGAAFFKSRMRPAVF